MTVYVITFPKGNRYARKFKVETDLDYEEVQSYISELKQIDPNENLYIAYGTAKEKRPDLDINDGEEYCPYCRDSREFPFNPSLGVKRCQICTISENDFHVRTWIERK